ncbi:MAG: ferric reductase-like transmembrane domain-containing protein [Phycisphaerales bacterium]|nr:ferric reductase-like transmembrane domain-containing protein [Phycisphaerales bacterium]
MSVGYRAVQWSRPKRLYDACAAGAMLAYLALFVGAGKLLWTGQRSISDEVLLIRATGSGALAMLHVLLVIGPLARLTPRALPLLFNRRHLGVMTFALAALHGTLVVGYYHGFGAVNPIRSLLVNNTRFDSLRAFPFELLGFAALLVMFVMAATSHDFWLKNLGAAAWKRLHMLVYPAYALLVGHVALGAVQSPRAWPAAAALAAGAACVTGFHLAAGWRSRGQDRAAPVADGWLDAGPAAEIPLDRARLVCAPGGGERIAVFRHAGGISAVTNVCAHQGGPLGEGRVIDGCITCPWHGWQYRPEDGCAPPPFKEKIPTHQVRIVAGRVRIDPRPLPPGTATPPARETSGA